MIFTKTDASTSDEKVEKLNIELNIHYKACIGSMIDLFSTRVDLSLAVHKLETYSSKTGKVQFEGLVHLLRYIRYNNTLALKYYTNINNAPVFDLLRQASTKTENRLTDFYDFSLQDGLDTVRITGAYIIFYQGGPIDSGTHVP